MGWIYKPHSHCNTPRADSAEKGSIWQCDECSKLWRTDGDYSYWEITRQELRDNYGIEIEEE